MQIKNGNAVNFNFEEKTYYVVEVAMRDSNPLHRAIFYSGYLNGPSGKPGGYAVIWEGSYEETHTGKVHYMDVISKIEMGQCERVLKT